MGYVEKLLGTNEQILFRTRRHFFDIFGKLLKELLVLIVVIIGFVALDRWNPAQLLLFQILLGLITVLAIFSMTLDILRWHNGEFIVTSRRVIQSKGILSKRVLDSSLSKINDVILEQSCLGRIFGYGTVKILTATEEVVNLLDLISRPVEFKHAMLDAKGNLEPTIPAAAAAGTSATTLLEELATLKERHMISEQESEEKRKEILKRM